MANTVPYISFTGNAQEAMDFYKECFGGELNVVPVEGSPVEADAPAEAKGGLLHACLVSGNIRLMASDYDPSAQSGSNISIMIECDSEEEINRLYTNLSAGGNATYPVGPAFWGGLFGTLTDKFGINWMLTANQEGCG